MPDHSDKILDCIEAFIDTCQEGATYEVTNRSAHADGTLSMTVKIDGVDYAVTAKRVG